MFTHQEIRDQAKQAFDRGDFAQAEQMFRSLWTNSNQPSKWDGWNLARSLRRIGQTQEALDVCRDVYRMDKAFDHNNSEVGWCLYDLYIKKDDNEIKLNETAFFEAADKILLVSKQGQFSANEKTVFRILKYLKPGKKKRNIAQSILSWAARLDPDLLSTEAEHYDRGDETEEGASPREKWFADLSAALFELGEYEACIDACERALASFERLHYGNQHWFRMRIANSRGCLGQIEEAIRELKDLARLKPEWFILHDIAKWYYHLGQMDNAFKYGIQSAQGHRRHDKLENKWELFLLLSRILKEKAEIERARSYALLAFKLRSEQKWGIPKDLNDLMQALEVNTEDDATAEDLYRKLKPEWEHITPRLNGTIRMVKPEKEFGFISGNDQQDYHFKYSQFKGKKQAITAGMVVTFSTQESYDAAKNRPSVVAIDVQAVRN